MSQNLRLQNFWRNWPNGFWENWRLLLLPIYYVKNRSIKRIMRYRVLKCREKLGKNCRVFLTIRMEGSFHPLAKNLLIILPTRKKFCRQQTSPFTVLSPLPLHKNFIMLLVLSKSRFGIKERKYTSKVSLLFSV